MVCHLKVDYLLSKAIFILANCLLKCVCCCYYNCANLPFDPFFLFNFFGITVPLVLYKAVLLLCFLIKVVLL